MTEAAARDAAAPGYFERVDEGVYKPTAHAGGAWRTDEQHFSPLGGLILHAVDRHLAAQDGPRLLVSRVSFDILGQIALDETRIVVETLRPGRTIELLEATAYIGGRAVVRARVWLLAPQDTAEVAGGGPEPLPAPESLPRWDLSERWSGGYIASIDVRPVGEPQPGRTTAWISSPLSVVQGEVSGPVAEFVALVDTANGIAVRRSPQEWMFPNVDLTVHFHRQPVAGWTGLDTTVVFGPTGQGVTSTVLHDVHGPVGYAEQQLTVRPQQR
ncbi:thioesterase family protein [Streptomyces sp. ODS28]|uniref:thioesterase family protein n=1 Tax=Streptomyces sp. ODS28 TaxID=3136688 RepID=UPI0031EB327F